MLSLKDFKIKELLEFDKYNVVGGQKETKWKRETLQHELIEEGFDNVRDDNHTTDYWVMGNPQQIDHTRTDDGGLV